MGRDDEQDFNGNVRVLLVVFKRSSKISRLERFSFDLCFFDRKDLQPPVDLTLGASVQAEDRPLL
jgi:hypothetical protein